MSYNGSDFYDNDTNFENYMRRRQGQENANDTLRSPSSGNRWEMSQTSLY